jgi:hypothetical protein
VSSDINEVTENRVTITANDSVENIRASAGFSEAEPDAEKAEKPSVEVKEGDLDKTPEDQAHKIKPTPPDPVKPDGDPRKSHQAKINQAIAKQREAERVAEDTRRKYAELEAEVQALRQPRTVAAASSPAPQPSSQPYVQLVQQYQLLPDAPKLQEFMDANLDDPYGAHYLAMTVFIAEKRQQEQDARNHSARMQQERTSHVNAALEVGEQIHPGLQQQIQADTRMYPNAVLDLIAQETAQDPNLSAELLHHLLTHPDDANVLATKVDPIAAAREIGRLIAAVSSAPSGPETLPTTTNAKPLIKPVRPSVMASSDSPPEDLPFGPKYIAAMNERERKAKEAGRA